MASATSFYEFKPLDKRGREFDLSSLQGKWVLVVNTASKCSFTPQYDGLEKLYQEVKGRGGGDSFEILGFPCNQFAAQEPGTDEEIQEFCRVNHGVTFPIMRKVDVNGDDAAPLWKWLKSEKPGIMGLQMIKWNFEKFLVDPQGKVVDRWASTTTPASIGKTIFKKLGLPEKPADAPSPEDAPKPDESKPEL
jgi:glutathione peroxidase-family protein